LTTPKLGSIVQKGKLALWALALDKQLKRVDLPTLGNPTIPAFIGDYIFDPCLFRPEAFSSGFKKLGKYSASSPLF